MGLGFTSSASRVDLGARDINRNAGSMALWARSGGSTSIETLMSWRVDGNNEIEIVDFRGNFGLNFRVAYTGGSTQRTVTNASLTAGVWTHVAITWDKAAAQFRLYINGALIGTATTLATIAGNPVLFNIGNNTWNEFYSGDLAEFGYWNEPLSGSEVEALAQGVPPNRVRPSALNIYTPLKTAEVIDQRSQIAAQVTNAKASLHPPMQPSAPLQPVLV